MGTIVNLFQVLRKIPDVSDDEAKQAADSTAYHSDMVSKAEFDTQMQQLVTKDYLDARIAELKAELEARIANLEVRMYKMLFKALSVFAAVIIGAMGILLRVML